MGGGKRPVEADVDAVPKRKKNRVAGPAEEVALTPEKKKCKAERDGTAEAADGKAPEKLSIEDAKAYFEAQSVNRHLATRRLQAARLREEAREALREEVREADCDPGVLLAHHHAALRHLWHRQDREWEDHGLRPAVPLDVLTRCPDRV